MFNKSRIIISVVFILSGLKTHAWSGETTAKAAVAAGCLAGAGLIGYTYFKNQPSAEELADRELKAELDQKIKDPLKVAARIKLKEFELLAYEDREKLLPAVIAFNNQENLATLLQQAYADCSENFDTYQKLLSDAEQKVLHSEEPIALTAIIISRHEAHNHRNINCFAQQNPEKLFIKNKTNPREFLARPLRPGECAIIGYSDGDIQIRLHDSDRRLLNELSLEKRDFIKSLAQHQRNPEGLELDSAETAMFYSLPPEIRNCLSMNYRIKTIGGVVLRNTEKAIWYALTLFNFTRYGQLIHEGKYWKCVGRFLLTGLLGSAYQELFGTNQRFNVAVMLATTASTEAALNGHYLVEKLGPKIFTPKATVSA